MEAERDDGLTEEEGYVADALCEAWNEYAALPVTHPTDQAEFLSAIHRCQDLLAVRIARRLFPEGWYAEGED